MTVTTTLLKGLMITAALVLAVHSPGFTISEKSDLIVQIEAPISARAGDDVGPALKVMAQNRGVIPAPGTIGILNPSNGYVIDIVLSKDPEVPAGYATYAPHYSEDVLLKGGRISNTADLRPGAKKKFRTGGGIPDDTPTGQYFVCARIDSANKVPESNESNNVRCAKIKIQGKEQPNKPDLVIRSFGLKKWGVCAPRQPVFYFEVRVLNIGTAASPAVPKKALVEVFDQHNKWRNGAKLGSIPPGGSQSVLIPVFYLASDPKHMTTQALHPFQAIVDPLKLVAELNEANNRSMVIQVGAPKGCP